MSYGVNFCPLTSWHYLKKEKYNKNTNLNIQRGFQMSKAIDSIRFIILIIITLALLSLGAVRIMKIQLVDGSAYLEKSKSSRIYEQVISAPRGEIADADGNYLVGNKSGFNVMLEKAFFPDDNAGANKVIGEAARLLATEGISPIDELPVTNNSPFEFLPDRESDIAVLRKNIGVQVLTHIHS